MHWEFWEAAVCEAKKIPGVMVVQEATKKAQRKYGGQMGTNFCEETNPWMLKKRLTNDGDKPWTLLDCCVIFLVKKWVNRSSLQ